MKRFLITLSLFVSLLDAQVTYRRFDRLKIDSTFIMDSKDISREAKNLYQNRIYNVMAYGAVADGVTDDTEAIRAAIADATAAEGMVYAIGDYFITDSIALTCEADMARATFHIDTTFIGAVLIIKPVEPMVDWSDYIQLINTSLPRVIATALTSTWTVNNTGVKIMNVWKSRIFLNDVEGFRYGYHFTTGGDGGGLAYNDFHLGNCYGNKISMLVNHGLNGWPNENTFYGGMLKMGVGGPNIVSGSANIWLDGADNNVFLRNCVEGSCEEYKFYFDNSAHNTFINTRTEVSPAGPQYFSIYVKNYSLANIFIAPYTYSLSAQYTHVIYGPNIPSYVEPISYFGQDGILMSGAADTTGVLKLQHLSGYYEPPLISMYKGNVRPLEYPDSIQSTISSSGFEFRSLRYGYPYLKADGYGPDYAGRLRIGSYNIDIDDAPYLYALQTYSKKGLGIWGDYLALPDNDWDDNWFVMGNKILWFDDNGIFRKNTSAPTSDTDGSIVNDVTAWAQYYSMSEDALTVSVTNAIPSFYTIGFDQVTVTPTSLVDTVSTLNYFIIKAGGAGAYEVSYSGILNPSTTDSVTFYVIALHNSNSFYQSENKILTNNLPYHFGSSSIKGAVAVGDTLSLIISSSSSSVTAVFDDLVFTVKKVGLFE